MKIAALSPILESFQYLLLQGNCSVTVYTNLRTRALGEFIILGSKSSKYILEKNCNEIKVNQLVNK